MTTIFTSASPRLLRSIGLATAITLAATFSLAQSVPPPSPDGPDPALVNLAPSDQAVQTQQAAPDPSANPQDYLQQVPAPIVRSAPTPTANPGFPNSADSYNAPDSAAGDPSSDPQANANIAAGEAALDDADIAADQPPPPLPDYDQPPAPADDYLWTPGYWGYAPAGYYWVPGVWIVPPYYGALWTPGYWGWWGNRYRWHPGYWGTHVGFYGGVNYGYGYIGVGYFGGYWNGGHFFYNRSVTNVGPSVTNVYIHTVVYNNHIYGAHPTSNVSYNGGRGGITVAPRPAELAAMHEAHTAPLAGQVRLQQTAAQNPQAAFSVNRGRPTSDVAVRTNPLGANRTILPSQSAYQPRPSVQQTNPSQTRVQTQQQHPQPQQQQSRPAPQYHPAPAYRPAPSPSPPPAPASHETGKK
jgi:hypothetical protein